MPFIIIPSLSIYASWSLTSLTDLLLNFSKGYHVHFPNVNFPYLPILYIKEVSYNVTLIARTIFSDLQYYKCPFVFFAKILLHASILSILHFTVYFASIPFLPGLVFCLTLYRMSSHSSAPLPLIQSVTSRNNVLDQRLHVQLFYSILLHNNSLRKPYSWMYYFVEVSGHILESSPTWGFHVQCLHYKPVSTTFAQGGWGGGGKSVSRGDFE